MSGTSPHSKYFPGTSVKAGWKPEGQHRPPRCFPKPVHGLCCLLSWQSEILWNMSCCFRRLEMSQVTAFHEGLVSSFLSSFRGPCREVSSSLSSSLWWQHCFGCLRSESFHASRPASSSCSLTVLLMAMHLTALLTSAGGLVPLPQRCWDVKLISCTSRSCSSHQ